MFEEKNVTVLSSEQPIQAEKCVLPVDRYDFLFGELDRLHSRGIVDESAIKAARDFYAPRSAESNLNTLFVILILLGLLAVGSASYILLREAWEELSRNAKLFWSSAPFIVAYVLGISGKVLRKEFFANLSLFAGAGLFWFSVVNSSFVDGNARIALMIISMASFGVAFFSNRDSLHYLAIFFIGCAILFGSGNYSNLSSLQFWLGHFEITLLLIALGGFWTYVRASKNVGECYACLAILWGIMVVLHHRFDYGWYFLIVFGAFLSTLLGIGRLYRFNLKLARTFVYFLISSSSAFLSAKIICRGIYSSNSSEHYGNIVLWYGLAFVVASIVALVVFYVIARRQNSKSRESRALNRLLSPEILSFLAIPLFVIEFCRVEFFAPWASLYCGFFLVAMIVAFLVAGLKNDAPKLYSGILGFVIWLLLTIDYSLRKGGIESILTLLLIVAVILFAVAWITRRFGKKSNDSDMACELEIIAERVPSVLMPERVAFCGLIVVVLAQVAYAAWEVFKV